MEASGETPAQRQARIRREKREKKILEGGSARLDKITGLSGRPALSNATTPAIAPVVQSQDPEEVDISNHPFASRLSAPSISLLHSDAESVPSEADLRRILPSEEASLKKTLNGPDGSLPQLVPGAGSGQEEIMRLLQQMMGGVPSAAGSQGQQGELGDNSGLPLGLAAMLGGGSHESAAEPYRKGPKYAYTWRILHAVFSITLGIYILLSYPFSGSLAARTLSVASVDATTHIFWVFATFEMMLQSSRFLLERGTNEGGMLLTVANFLPQPWNGRLRLANQYSGIWTTLVEDSMVVVFVVGLAAWWQRDF